MDNFDSYLDPHYIQHSNWLRAAVLGANDGILSMASLALGVTGASDIKNHYTGHICWFGRWCFINGRW